MRRTPIQKLFLIYVLSFMGCVSHISGVNSQEGLVQNRILAQELVQKDWNQFVNFSVQNFSPRISHGFRPDKSEFIKNLETAFYANIPIDMSFTLNTVSLRQNKLAVSVTWQRRTADRNTGTITLKEGNCLIVYHQEDNNWRLYQIRGNSLFIF